MRASLGICISCPILAFLTVVSPARAQSEVQLTVRVISGEAPVADATVTVAERRLLTDSAGTTRFSLPPGMQRVSVARIGYANAAAEVLLRAGRDTTLVVQLLEQAIEDEVIVVEATRGNRRVEDEPVRVEVLAREEIEEKMLMTPGNIAMLLNESTGLRVQDAAPSLGGANLRIQGLRGRYTQILTDGLPLYGGQTGTLGLLQVPPLDLRQVEVIKGAASALYGASALGGVVNLVSRRPEGEHELLLNATTRQGVDVTAFTGDALSTAFGYTVIGGWHMQERADVDEDGWSDIPEYRRAQGRARLFWSAERAQVMGTAGVVTEDRQGGGRVPSGGDFARGLDTNRLDAGITARALLGKQFAFAGRASAMRAQHDHVFGDIRERDTHSTAFIEASVRGAVGQNTALLGVALQNERYNARDVAGFDYRFRVPSVFMQIESNLTSWAALSASARVDRHSEYGAFWPIRSSLLVRLSKRWTFRASSGTAYFAPTPFTDETEEVGLTRVFPLEGARAERAWSASADIGGFIGPVEVNATLFGSRVSNALAVQEAAGVGALRIVNLPGRTNTRGTELLARLRRGALSLTASHTHLRATEPHPMLETRREVPLTPRHAAGLVGVWEEHEVGRAGFELYYTGRQQLEDDPRRMESEPFVIVGVLVERRFGRLRAFLNLENLTDRRQTRYVPVVRPFQTSYGRWTTDAWAPLEGRVFNGGIRVQL